MSKFDINDNQMNPFTHESKSSMKKHDGELMLLKMNTSSNDELIELNILKSSHRVKVQNTEQASATKNGQESHTIYE